MIQWGKPLERGEVVAIDRDGAVIAGRYVSRKRVEVPNQGTSMLHKFELAEDAIGVEGNPRRGSVVQVWGSTILDELLTQCRQGQLVRIAFKGKEKLPGPGDREMKQWEVCPALESDAHGADNDIAF